MYNDENFALLSFTLEDKKVILTIAKKTDNIIFIHQLHNNQINSQFLYEYEHKHSEVMFIDNFMCMFDLEKLKQPHIQLRFDCDVYLPLIDTLKIVVLLTSYIPIVLEIISLINIEKQKEKELSVMDYLPKDTNFHYSYPTMLPKPKIPQLIPMVCNACNSMNEAQDYCSTCGMPLEQEKIVI